MHYVGAHTHTLAKTGIQSPTWQCTVMQHVGIYTLTQYQRYSLSLYCRQIKERSVVFSIRSPFYQLAQNLPLQGSSSESSFHSIPIQLLLLFHLDLLLFDTLYTKINLCKPKMISFKTTSLFLLPPLKNLHIQLTYSFSSDMRKVFSLSML